MCVKAQLPDLALKQIADFRTRYRGSDLKEDEQMELLRAEAWAYVVKNDLGGAEQLLTGAQERYPKQPTPWETLVDIYLQLGSVTNAVEVLDRQLKSQPDSARALVNYGALKLGMGQFAEALPLLDRALQISPTDEAALVNRALANFSLDRLDAAQRDYEALLGAGSSSYRTQVLFGLAETCFRKKNRRESLRYYHDFLKIAPAGIPQIDVAKGRIRVLEGAGAF